MISYHDVEYKQNLYLDLHLPENNEFVDKLK